MKEQLVLSTEIAEKVLDDNPSVANVDTDNLTPKDVIDATRGLIQATGVTELRDSPDAAQDLVEAAAQINETLDAYVLDPSILHAAAIRSRVRREYRENRNRMAALTGRTITRLY